MQRSTTSAHTHLARRVVAMLRRQLGVHHGVGRVVALPADALPQGIHRGPGVLVDRGKHLQWRRVR